VPGESEGGEASVKAVFFDLDGTLVDSNELHVMAWGQAFHDFGHHISHELIRPQIGKGADMLIPALLPESTDEQRERIAQRHDEAFERSYLPQVRAFPGAMELVRCAHRAGAKTMLASSANSGDVDHYINLLGIREFLTGSTSADDVRHSKPAGDIFASALQKVAPTLAKETIVVGDTPYDAIAAGRCGIRCVALLSGGFSEAQLTEAGAVAVYASARELLEIPLERWACGSQTLWPLTDAVSPPTQSLR
jgi:membrane protein